MSNLRFGAIFLKMMTLLHGQSQVANEGKIGLKKQQNITDRKPKSIRGPKLWDANIGEVVL